MSDRQIKDGVVDSLPSIGECVILACAWEVMAPKPGNVSRSADFETTTFQDFVTSAIVIGPIMERADSFSIGELVLSSVEATARWVGDNTNLGLILLLAPLAKAAAQSRGSVDQATVTHCLQQLDNIDAALVYRAIRLAKPGGLGASARWDVANEAPANLMAAMELAASRDAIALQYCSGFDHVFQTVVPGLVEQMSHLPRLVDAIVYTQMQSMAVLPDSLIGRKCGLATAQESALRAAGVLLHETNSSEYLAALSDFDFWLRADGNRRNPGTTADLIGAGLFVALRNRLVKPPLH